MEEKTLVDRENLTQKQSTWELIKFALIAAAVVIPIRIFIAQPFIVSGSSMVPTFENGNYLIIDEISYRLEEPKRNDVVVFRYPNDTKKFFIKRIIALPGETINIRGSEVIIINKKNPDGFVLNEPYIKNIAESNVHLTLNEKEYFVMGDNRSASSDSRYWGAVPRKLLVGRALIRLFPLNEIDLLPGSYEQIE